MESLQQSEERRLQSALGLPHAPRVLWDMTFTVGNRGGTFVYAHQLFEALTKASAWEFQIIYAQAETASVRAAFTATIQKNWWLMYGAEQRIKPMGADLFHAAAFLAPLRVPCPLITNVFDTTYLAYPEHFDWKWNLYARTVIPSAVKRSAAVVTLSEHARGEIARHYEIPSARVHVVPPGVSAEFRPVADAAVLASMRERYHLPENYLLYVGGGHPRKNLPALLAACSQVRNEMPDLRLALVGPNLETPLLDSVIDRAGLQNFVQRIAFVPPADLPLLYAGARAFVYASLMEGFGMPPVEAMACGTPVIAMPHPPLPQVLGDAAYFSVDSSPQALAQAIVRVLNDDALLRELRARGAERAKLYTWADAARKTLAVYENVLGI